VGRRRQSELRRNHSHNLKPLNPAFYSENFKMGGWLDFSQDIALF